MEELSDCLFEFLLTNGEAFEEEEKSILFLIDLSKNDGANLLKSNNVMIPGIYSFGLSGPHFNNYLVLITLDEVKIVEKYNIENILVTLHDFFVLDEMKFPELMKLNVTESVLQILNIRLENEILERKERDVEIDK